MGRSKRKEIIERIELHRSSKVLVYFVGDRPLLGAKIASDSIRWLYEHLRSMNGDKKVDTIDFYIYSRGGSLETPWPIISILREYCENLNVLIPYKAFSAATLTALGADKILMGRKGELGPIDPQIVEERRTEESPGTGLTKISMSTEDISSYISFIKNKVGIKDQSALAVLTKSLTDTLSPPTLGQVNRVHFHIREVAGKMLSQTKPALDAESIQEIIKTLTERTFIHGHSIGRHEAKQIGLQVDDMDEKLEKLCWDLFLQYEEDLRLNSPANIMAYFDGDDQNVYEEEHIVTACIESINRCHEYSGPLLLKKIRQQPPQLTLNVNLPIQIPANIQSQEIPSHVQHTLRQMQEDATKRIKDEIAGHLRNTMPVEGININIDKMAWNEV